MSDLSVDAILDVISEIVPLDTSLAIANSKKFIYYHPSERINLNIRPGDMIDKKTVTFEALNTQQKMSLHKNDELYGIPYYGVSVPILDAGKPKGCVTAIMPRELELRAPFLTVQTSDRWLVTPLKDVIVLEAKNRKTMVQAVNHSGEHKLNLSELEILLSDDQFVRCHRSFVVNLNHIKEIHPHFHSTFTLIMKNGLKVPVSQTYASEFRQKMHF